MIIDGFPTLSNEYYNAIASPYATLHDANELNGFTVLLHLEILRPELDMYQLSEIPRWFCSLSELFPKRRISDSSKLRDFADDNFKFDENSRMFSRRVENTMGKGEIARYEQFLRFPQ